MLIEEVKKLSAMERYLYWVKERESVRLNRKAGKAPPWSDDLVMQTTFFTNVRREDDKVTTWVRKRLRLPLAGDDSVLFAIIAFRWFNYIPTGELLMREELDPSYMNGNLLLEWDLDMALERLNAAKKDGLQVFTGAFTISNSGSTEPKVVRVCKSYIQPVWEDLPNLIQKAKGWKTLQQAHKDLSHYPGLGGSGFMAAQVICDLAYTHLLDKAKISDWWTWCSPGPGSRRGLNIILGEPLEAPVPKNWLEYITKLRNLIKYKLGMELHARDVQNTLCEFSKFERVLEGGRSKRKYPGRGDGSPGYTRNSRQR